MIASTHLTLSMSLGASVGIYLMASDGTAKVKSYTRAMGVWTILKTLV